MNDVPSRDVEIFTEALALPRTERVAYLERACGGDAELRRKVETLLARHDQIGDFLEDSPQTILPKARAGAFFGEKPGDRIGHYKLLQQIGEGGSGVVFMAEQEEPVRRRVALKLIKAGMDTKSVIARFEAERQALALMDHPSIAKIFDAGATDSGRPYFVMELVRGIKITEYCDQHALATQERLKLFAQVCHAVQHAHQKGIIHRDIKPSNILVTETEQGALPVVIDFGIAKATTNQPLTDKTLFTAFEMLIGTPAYMSPEQAALTNMDVDTRTDIYSLGVLLYELLTGSTPFDTGDLLKAGLDEIRRVIREQDPVRPSTRLSKLTKADLTTVAQSRHSEPPALIRSVHGDLDWIVMKALEKDRTRRYATANGLAVDVGRYLTGEAIWARPPSVAYKLRKLVARNKLLFSGVTLIIVLLTISLITTTRWLMTERRTQEQLRQQMELARLDGLGMDLYYQKKSADAEEAILKALEMRRQFPQAEYSSHFMRETVLLLIFINGGKFEKIKPFFDVYVNPANLSKLQCQAMFETATLALAKQGRWNDAASLADHLYRFQPTNSSYYHILAPLMVARNDVGNYRRLCGEIMTRFSDATDPYVADQMAKDCLILPSSGVDLKAVAALADVAVSRGSNAAALPYFQFCKALAEYRLGHYNEAINWARLVGPSVFSYPKADASAIIAMSQFKLNELDKARAALADCSRIMEEKTLKPGQPPGEDWRDWVIAHALHSEAKQLIEGDDKFDRNLPSK